MRLELRRRGLVAKRCIAGEMCFCFLSFEGEISRGSSATGGTPNKYKDLDNATIEYHIPSVVMLGSLSLTLLLSFVGVLGP